MSGDAKRVTASPRNVAHAIVIKDEDVFLMSEHGGGIPAGNQDGFGLYYHDCRFLNGYSLEMAGTKPNPLVSNADRGSIADFEMTNEKLQLADGNLIQAQTFGIRLQRAVDGQNCAVRDVYTFDNYDVVDHELPLCLRFKSDFEDIFEIRGLHPAKRGRQNEPEWHDGVLALNYAGADGVSRKVEVHIDPGPDAISGAEAQFSLRLRAKDQQQIKVSLRIAESKGNQIKTARDASEITHLSHFSTERSEKWLSEHAELHTDNPYVNDTVRRCLLDLLMLNSSLEGCEFFAAGLPWYGTLFGRDSIVAAIETLAFEPRIAVQTIRLLAKFQGTKTDEWRDEQPGKILHELRRGELANLNEIPQTPYYGSVDSTPLFLILIGEHANWTGNLSIFNEFRPNVERAIKWIDEYGDEARNGYLSYATKSSKGLKNQGWKDSDDAITNADGSIAKPRSHSPRCRDMSMLLSC